MMPQCGSTEVHMSTRAVVLFALIAIVSTASAGSKTNDEGVGDALGRGATRFLLRLAGLPSLRLEVRSTTFEVR